MTLWQQLRNALGFPVVRLDSSLYDLLQDMAVAEQLSPDDVATGLLQRALGRYQDEEECLRRWRTLSPREQQVAVLVCTDHTNEQIASQLGVTRSTVKAHVSNILRKFGLRSRADLRLALAGWDFDALGWHDRQGW